MALFKVGEAVVWVRAVANDGPDVIGKVVAVMPSDSKLDEFALYDIKFDFGTFTLHGTQLKTHYPKFNPTHY